MRTGKISETVLKRSVLKNIKNNNEKIISGPGFGNDGAVIKISGNEIVVSTSVVTEKIRDKAFYGINRAVNNIAARNAVPAYASVSVLIGTDTAEDDLKEFMKETCEICNSLGLSIAGGHTEVTASVNGLIPSFTVIGEGRAEYIEPEFKSGNTASVIMTKYAGIEGTALIAEEKYEELSSYYNLSMINSAKLLKNDLRVGNEVYAAYDSAPVLVHDISQGGVLSALWDISEKTGMGMDIDLRAVPIKQETVEICEYFALNPYELLSGGSILIITEEEERVLDALEKTKTPAAVIGSLNNGRDRILRNNEIKSFLNRPSADGIYKLF